MSCLYKLVVFDVLNDGILLRVRLMPNSSCCRLNGIFIDADGVEFLKLSIVSVPEKGKANKELIALLAKKIKVAKSQCNIVGGELDRYKKIKIMGDTEVLVENLKAWLGEKE